MSHEYLRRFKVGDFHFPFTVLGLMKGAYLIRCSLCGGEKKMTSWGIRKMQSCGCARKANIAKSLTTHGLSRTPTWRVWACMVQRCTNPKNIGWKNYGGRGITVCERWKDFSFFLEDMGLRPVGTELDRKDNSLGYSRENCRWVTRLENANNKRNNRYLQLGDRQQTLPQWARELKVSPDAIRNRLSIGWSVERALTTPFRRTYS